MNTKIPSFGSARKEVPDDWFGGEPEGDSSGTGSQERKPVHVKNDPPRKSVSRLARFIGLFIPAPPIRLLILLSVILFLPIASEIANQIFLIKGLERWVEDGLLAQFGFAVGLIGFAFGGIFFNRLSVIERVLVILAVVGAGALSQFYKTPSRFDFYSITGDRTDEWVGFGLYCVVTLVACVVAATMLKRQRQTLTNWGSKLMPNFGIAVMLMYLSQYAVRYLLADQRVPEVDFFDLGWRAVGPLFALVVMFPTIFILSHVRGFFGKLGWSVALTGWGLVFGAFLFSSIYREVVQYLTWGGPYALGIAISQFGIAKSGEPESRTSTKGIVWSGFVVYLVPLWAIMLAAIVINHYFYIPRVYNSELGFRWMVAAELKKLESYGTLEFREFGTPSKPISHLEVKFADRADLRKVPQISDEVLMLNGLRLAGVTPDLEISRLPKSGTYGVHIDQSKVSVKQLAELSATILFLNNVDLVDDGQTVGKIGTRQFTLKRISENTLAKILRNHEDLTTITWLLVHIEDLGKEDWEAILDNPDLRIQVHVADTEKGFWFMSDEASEIRKRLTTHEGLRIQMGQPFPKREVLFDFLHEIARSGIAIDMSTYAQPRYENKQKELEFCVDFYLLFGFTVRSWTIEWPEEVDYESQDLRDLNLLYTDPQNREVLWLPFTQQNWKIDAKIAQQLEVLSLDPGWSGADFWVPRRRLLNAWFNSEANFPNLKELYLPSLSDTIGVFTCTFLQMFPNLEFLQIDLQGSNSKTEVQELCGELPQLKKLKRMVVIGSVPDNLMEVIVSMPAIEEVVIYGTDSIPEGEDVFNEIRNNVKLTYYRSEADIPIPEHFKEHHQRVREKLIEKFRMLGTAGSESSQESEANTNAK
ncbi:MAG: hypothetical protein KF851_14360 [Pirellulaceae bacterium]|nr:hypothetical protein [Pirellulaceae bacterium]